MRVDADRLGEALPCPPVVLLGEAVLMFDPAQEIIEGLEIAPARSFGQVFYLSSIYLASLFILNTHAIRELLKITDIQ